MPEIMSLQALLDEKQGQAGLGDFSQGDEKRSEAAYDPQKNIFNDYVEDLKQKGGGDGEMGVAPIYVNAKQYHRILRRREERTRLANIMVMKDKKKPYLHKSRHDHAMRRPRGPGGRFLTKEELSKLKLGYEGDYKAADL